jgi:hypothetical protein
MLFMLFINLLNKLLAKAKDMGVLRPIDSPELVISFSLCAADVVIFCHPDEAKLSMVIAILALFGGCI